MFSTALLALALLGQTPEPTYNLLDPPAVVAASAYDAQAKELISIQGEVRALKQEVEELRAGMKMYSNTLADARAQLEASEAKVAKLQAAKAPPVRELAREAVARRPTRLASMRSDVPQASA